MHNFFFVDRLHGDFEIDTILNGARDTAIVDFDGALCAAAWNFWITEKSARARVGSGEHEKLARVGHASGGASECNDPIFNGLAK